MSQMFDTEQGWATEYRNIVMIEKIDLASQWNAKTQEEEEQWGLKLYMRVPKYTEPNIGICRYTTQAARDATYRNIIDWKNSIEAIRVDHYRKDRF